MANGHQATVFSANPGLSIGVAGTRREETLVGQVRLIRLNSPTPAWMRWRPGMMWNRIQLLWALRQQHRRTPFDLIEAADAWGWLPLGKVRGVPMVTRLHGAMFFFDHELQRMTGDPFTYWLEKQSLARSDFIVAVSKFVAQGEMALSRKPNAPVQVIYNAVDTDFFCPDPAQPGERGLIVFVNSLQYRKGVSELCQAFNLVAEKNPQARLVMIGPSANTAPGAKPITEELRELIFPEWRNRVTFTGSLPRAEVRPWLRRAQVCCYPSKLECFSLAPLEAMAAGKAVVYTRAASGPETVEDGVSGLLCDPANPADIAAKLQRVLDNPGLAEQLGRAARQRVERLFSRADFIRRNLDFYASCLKQVRGAATAANGARASAN